MNPLHPPHPRNPAREWCSHNQTDSKPELSSRCFSSMGINSQPKVKVLCPSCDTTLLCVTRKAAPLSGLPQFPTNELGAVHRWLQMSCSSQNPCGSETPGPSATAALVPTVGDVGSWKKGRRERKAVSGPPI